MVKSQAGIGKKAQERSRDLIQSRQDLCLSRLGMQAGTVAYRKNSNGCSPINGWERGRTKTHTDCYFQFHLFEIFKFAYLRLNI